MYAYTIVPHTLTCSHTTNTTINTCRQWSRGHSLGREDQVAAPALPAIHVVHRQGAPGAQWYDPVAVLDLVAPGCGEDIQ